LSYENRAHLFWFLAGVSFLSLFIYFYAINATARNVALRGNLERETQELSSEIAKLEFEYIELRGKVTLEKARELGFAEVKEPLYITTRKSGESLSFNTPDTVR